MATLTMVSKLAAGSKPTAFDPRPFGVAALD
jgi:hypothetical protein